MLKSAERDILHKMQLKSLVEFLWVAGMFLQATLVVVLALNRAWKTLPVFTVYSAFSLFSALLTYLAQPYRFFYFYSYWITEAASMTLGFAVLYEVFGHLFQGHGALRKLARLSFNCALLVFLCIGMVVLLKQSAVGFRAISSAVLIVEQAARIIELGVLMALFLLSTAFGLHWRQQVFGIALGLGLFTAIELIAVTMRAQTGSTTYYLLGAVRILAFNTSLIIWLGYLLVPEHAASEVELPEQSQLEQWNQAVMELIRQ